jgi:hypothetical protein
MTRVVCTPAVAISLAGGQFEVEVWAGLHFPFRYRAWSILDRHHGLDRHPLFWDVRAIWAKARRLGRLLVLRVAIHNACSGFFCHQCHLWRREYEALTAGGDSGPA